MFGGFKRVLGVISVVEDEDTIKVEGIPADTMERDINKIWKTSKITSNLFIKLTSNSFVFHKFFAIEILYIIDSLITNKRAWTNVKTLQKIKVALLENTWLKNLDQNVKFENILDLSIIDKVFKPEYRPLDFQKEFLDYYNNNVPRYNLRGALFHGAPGSGKTFTFLALSETLESDYVFIFCPKKAVDKPWGSSFTDLFKKTPTFFLSTRDNVYKKQKYIVIHHEAISKAFEILDQLPKDSKITIGADESHYLNEEDSIRTKEFLRFCELSECKNIIRLTGTAFKAYGSESIPLFKSIDPLFTEDIEVKFRAIFGANAAKGLDILNHRLGFVMFNVPKSRLNLKDPDIKTFEVKFKDSEKYTLSNVKDEMRKFVEQRLKYYKTTESQDTHFYEECVDVFYRLNKSDRNKMRDLELYKDKIKLIQKFAKIDLARVKEEVIFCNRFEKEFIISVLKPEDKVRFLSVKSLVKYPELKVQGECLGSVLGKMRIQCFTQIAENIDYATFINNTLKKTLVFTSFVEVLEKARDAVVKLGFNPILVYGKTNHDLKDNIIAFEKREELNPLIATFNSLSDAVPLVMADTLIMVNTPYRSYIEEQTISRIHRLGQDSTPVIRIAVLNTGDQPNLSSRTLDILQWSKTQVEQITGIKSPYEVKEGLECFNNQSSLSVENYDSVKPSNIVLSIESFCEDINIQYNLSDEKIIVENVKKQNFNFW